MSKAEDPFGGGRVQPFGQRREHHGDLVRGSFQTVQRRVAPSTERGVAGLAAKGLDLLGTAMLAIPDEGVELSIGIPEARALLIRTGEAFGGYALGGSPPAFHLTPGTHRHECRLSSRRGRGGESTGGAIVWRARLEQTGEHGAFGHAF